MRPPTRPPAPALSDHSEDCTELRFVWQAPLLPDLPRRGFCPDCGAVAITRSTPATRRTINRKADR